MVPSRPLALSGDPFELVEPLLDEPGAFIAFDEGRAVFGCRPLESSTALDPEPTLELKSGSSVPRWFGLLPYEAFRDIEQTREPDRRAPPLIEQPLWHRYGAVALFDASGTVSVAGDDEASVEYLSRALDGSVRAGERRARPRVSLELTTPIEAPELHERRITEALEHIARGNLYQVNLARRFDFQVSGHPIELLAALGAQARARFASAGCFGSAGWVSTSPELLLDLNARRELTTVPIKGTRPRGASSGEDERLKLELEGSDKERAELAMVIDVERNDLGRVAVAGSVRMLEPPRVVTHSTVHHREATLVAQLRPGVSRAALMKAMLPSGSVTGAPKMRAMQLISELEAERRGLYTGGLGFVGHDGSLRLSMAIRTLTLRGGLGHYFSGGGIVAESQPRAEVEETLWKARQLGGLASPLAE